MTEGLPSKFNFINLINEKIFSAKRPRPMLAVQFSIAGSNRFDEVAIKYNLNAPLLQLNLILRHISQINFVANVKLN